MGYNTLNSYNVNTFTPKFNMNGFNPDGTYNWGNLGGATVNYTTSPSESTNIWASSNKQQNSTVFGGLTKKEEKAIEEYHANKQEYIEHLPTSLAFGAVLGLGLPHGRNSFHWGSALKSTFSKNSETNKMFDSVRKTDIWKKEAGLLQNAYMQMQKAEVRANKRKFQGLLKRGYTASEMDELKKIMQTAINSGDAEQIKEATAKLQNANSVRDGWIPKAWRKVKGVFGFKSNVSTVADKLDDMKGIEAAKKALNSTTNMSLKNCFKTSLGGKFGIAMSLLSLASEYKYIEAAFKKDSETGWKQFGQSAAKAGASWGGYIIGDALGKWGGAKLGAIIGTTVCPGLGTLIGAVGGVLVGTVCSWGLRKIANLVTGDNVANKLIAKNDIKNLKTEEEKAEFLQQIYAQAKEDDNLDPRMQKIVKKFEQAA